MTSLPPEDKSRVFDWIICGLICLLVAAFFFKTCFAGASISRLCVLAEWDSVFDAWRTGKAQPYDPSLVQIFLPDYVFLARNLCKGILPLWNPYCGLGYPFVGDIQTSMFAPLRALFDLMPTLRSYNFFLIGEVVFCAVSMYLLTRSLIQPQRSPLYACIPALFAAVCYTFCPYNLWYLELNLGSSAVLFPLTTLAFVHAAKKKTAGSAALAGISSGLLILSGHPECSFFGISLASALMVLLLLFDQQRTIWRRIFAAAILLVIAGLSAVAVSAPALFPFAEYLLNGESYKYGSAYSTPVTWNGILFNLCNPGENGASPYLGIIAVSVLPLCMLGLRRASKNRQATLALVCLSAFSFLLVSQLGPIQVIFSKPPLTAVITRYALPYLLMLLSIVAAIGLSEAAQLCSTIRAAAHGESGGSCESSALSGNRLKMLLIPAIAFVLLSFLIIAWTPLLAKNTAWLKLADFDSMLPPTAWNPQAWRRDIVCLAVFSASSLLCFLANRIQAALPGGVPRAGRRMASPLRHRLEAMAIWPALTPGIIMLVVALICGAVSETTMSKLSLPLQSKFFYPEISLLEKLRGDQFRCLSTCEYVLRPATNAVYGINYLCVHNPLFPRRFLTFMKACGAQTDIFNQRFNTRLSPLLNLASIKYVLSLEPVEDAGGRTSERFQLVSREKNNIRIYENLDAAPRAYLVHTCKNAASQDEALAGIQAPGFDARSTVIVEEDRSTTREPDAQDKPTGATAQTKFEQVSSLQLPDPNKVEIICQIEAPSWLVLTDIYYPGWQAYVDGKKTPIVRANYAFRAIKLAPGKHKVLFAYQPYSFFFACGIFAAFAVLSALAVAAGIHKRTF